MHGYVADESVVVFSNSRLVDIATLTCANDVDRFERVARLIVQWLLSAQI